MSGFAHEGINHDDKNNYNDDDNDDAGILDGSRKILDKTRDLLEAALADHPGYRLVLTIIIMIMMLIIMIMMMMMMVQVLTGHSLGAGTVELMTLELLLGPMSVIVPPGTQVSCVALAPPPVYRYNRQ